MSAIRRNHSQPAKKDETQTNISIGDISSGSAIAIGRGWETNVVSQVVPEPAAEAIAVEAPPTMDELDQIIEQSALAPERKGATKAMLHDKVVPEVEKGEQADILTVQQHLVELSSCLPELRAPLRLFIEGISGVSVPVKIIARKLLV